MYEIKINDDTFGAQIEGGKIMVDKQSVDWDLVQIKTNFYHLLAGGGSYTLEVLSWDKANKSLTLALNNKIAVLSIKTEQDLLLEKLGLNHLKQQQISDITAPMPGLILDVQVKEGQNVEKGEILLVLEAMKMENALKSPQSGEIKKVLVSPGQGVEKNQLLVQF
ncbi:acetyl-CoA carboxylase biotin carboxyl carrier protein subunit [Pleomorphovibrio marinus]|uniref:acetyl-CoA carboxylase biotin carboxyl carrier protein subunit n=1 Tax=Pleomorphovibrio marinus TaxID=2164132 RepID=UPI000E0C90F5|nr:acetyl-CoA carboxylase biotin carboxyl carrier protein subunit [Pleomorphovibrio marinus]